MLTFGRVRYLRECLASLLRSSNPSVREIIVVVNGRDPDTEQYLRGISPSCPEVKPRFMPRRCRGEARNWAIGAASGNVLYFTDDDTIFPEGYFDRLCSKIKARPDISVFGGGQLSPESGVSVFQRAVGYALGCGWGSGPFRGRFVRREQDAPGRESSLVLCNLAVKKSVLDSNGLAFEGHLTSAEENLLISRMESLGVGMLFSPDLSLYHRRRSGYRQFLRQIFHSGMGRLQITALNFRCFSPATALPAAALFAFAAVFAFSPAAGGLMLLSYAVVSCVCAARALVSSKDAAVSAWTLALFPGIHLSYALGYVYALAELAADALSSKGGRPRRCVCEGTLPRP